MGTCIVTGAGDGNGAAIARSLSDAGHRVIGIDLAFKEEQTSYIQYTADILLQDTKMAAFHLALEKGVEDLHLINNAGITTQKYPQTIATLEEVLNVNLKAPFDWSNTYLAHAVKQKFRSGGIVNIGSLATETGFPRNPAYQASKGAILGLTRSFAVDLGPLGLRANCVSPGYIRTAMTAASYANVRTRKQRTDHTLLGRWGSPEDVANAVTFLCSEQATYITGVNLPVDGGWLAKGLISPLSD